MILLIFSGQAKMAQSILGGYLKKGYPKRDDFNYVCFDMGVTPVSTLAEECGMLPLGYDKKAVVGENCLFLSRGQGKYKYAKGDSPDGLLAYLNNPDPNIDLFLLVYSDDLDTASPLFKAIKKNGEIKQVAPMRPEQWIKYIESYFLKRNAPIEKDAVQELYKRTGGDYANFLNEAQKLLAYSNGETIQVQDVALLVAPLLDDDVFHLTNALSRGDVEAALRIYRALKVRSVDEVFLVNLLANQFRYTDEVRFLDAKGLSSGDIARELGGSPYRVEMTLRTLFHLKENALTKALEDLYDLDYRILSGQVDPGFGFSVFLANFSL